MASDAFKEKARTSAIFLLPMSGPDYLAYLEDLQAQTQQVYDQAPW